MIKDFEDSAAINEAPEYLQLLLNAMEQETIEALVSSDLSREEEVLEKLRNLKDTREDNISDPQLIYSYGFFTALLRVLKHYKEDLPSAKDLKKVKDTKSDWLILLLRSSVGLRYEDILKRTDQTNCKEAIDMLLRAGLISFHYDYKARKIYQSTQRGAIMGMALAQKRRYEDSKIEKE